MADNSIALGIQPMATPDYAGATMNRINMMGNVAKLDAYKRQMGDQNALAKMLQDPTFDVSNPTHRNALLSVPGGADMLKALGEYGSTTSRAAASDAETNAKKFKLETDKIDVALKDITGYTTKEDTLAGIERHRARGDIDETKASGLVQALNAAPSFEAWQMGSVRGLLDAKDRLAQTFTNQDTGGGLRTIATPTYGGGPARIVEGSAVAKTMTPGDVQQAVDAKAGRGVTTRGQNMTRDAANDPNVVANITTSADGTVHQFNKFGQEIGTGVKGAGKPSATFEKTAAQRVQLKQDLDSTISELTDIIKPGGLIDKATGSGAGALYNAGAGFFGGAPEGAQAIGALKPIYDKALKMVPRFEGPQSDKDTKSYQDAAGNLANSATPRAVKKAAATEMLRLMNARKGQFVTRDMAEGGGVPAGGGGVDTSNSLLN
jgi:hypothetical protein